MTKLVLQGEDFSTEAVIELINRGRQRAIDHGATAEASTEKLMDLYDRSFFGFYKIARNDYVGMKKQFDDGASGKIRVERANKIASDQFLSAQFLIIQTANILHIIKILLKRVGEQATIADFIRRKMESFPARIMATDLIDSSDEEQREDYKKRNHNLPSHWTFYKAVVHRKLPVIIKQRTVAAITGPAHLLADRSAIEISFKRFMTLPPEYPMGREGRPMLHQHNQSLRQSGAEVTNRGEVGPHHVSVDAAARHRRARQHQIQQQQ